MRWRCFHLCSIASLRRSLSLRKANLLRWIGIIIAIRSFLSLFLFLTIEKKLNHIELCIFVELALSLSSHIGFFFKKKLLFLLETCSHYRLIGQTVRMTNECRRLVRMRIIYSRHRSLVPHKLPNIATHCYKYTLLQSFVTCVT